VFLCLFFSKIWKKSKNVEGNSPGVSIVIIFLGNIILLTFLVHVLLYQGRKYRQSIDTVFRMYSRLINRYANFFKKSYGFNFVSNLVVFLVNNFRKFHKKSEIVTICRSRLYRTFAGFPKISVLVILMLA